MPDPLDPQASEAGPGAAVAIAGTFNSPCAGDQLRALVYWSVIERHGGQPPMLVAPAVAGARSRYVPTVRGPVAAVAQIVRDESCADPPEQLVRRYGAGSGGAVAEWSAWVTGVAGASAPPRDDLMSLAADVVPQNVLDRRVRFARAAGFWPDAPAILAIGDLPASLAAQLGAEWGHPVVAARWSDTAPTEHGPANTVLANTVLANTVLANTVPEYVTAIDLMALMADAVAVVTVHRDAAACAGALGTPAAFIEGPPSSVSEVATRLAVLHDEDGASRAREWLAALAGRPLAASATQELVAEMARDLDERRAEILELSMWGDELFSRPGPALDVLNLRYHLDRLNEQVERLEGQLDAERKRRRSAERRALGLPEA